MTRNTMRPQLEGRNYRIWMARADGATPQQIAEKFEMSVPNVHAILKQYAASIPEEERMQTAKLRRTYLDKLIRKTMELVEKPPAPAFAPNGKPHVDPTTGEPVYDYSLRLNSIAAAVKLDERVARLTGTDNAIQYSVNVSTEAQQATQDAAAKELAEFPEILGVVPAGSG